MVNIDEQVGRYLGFTPASIEELNQQFLDHCKAIEDKIESGLTEDEFIACSKYFT